MPQAGDQPVTGSFRRKVTRLGQLVVDWGMAGAGGPQALQPLTARFNVDQHREYVDYLNVALLDSKVRNIALTGRYGSGKSSVLEQFARENRRRVLLLSLSTLGPDNAADEETGPNSTQALPGAGGITHARVNRIEKELVKQLLHREPPAKLPQSRYQRIERLTFWRAFAQSALALVVVFTSLWLFDALPHVPRLASSESAWLRLPAAVVAAIAAVAGVAWIRLAVHNRLEVSQVSAAGASVTLTKKTDSYFDQYLDEIVYFFESRPAIDVVVFEDLDRFNQAGIFEALRELNTLLNSSRQITVRAPWRRGTRTIRFVYALRDSIFEQLGHDTKQLDDDAAQAEAVRANRTKFFDLVVPLVPFITHRTARELLAKTLTDDKLTPVPAVSDDLIDIAARHIPDMRLLTNIRNEYAVFARRLITNGQGMDQLPADQLFAMVVYKNLHLEDFELILLGRSDLDTLYEHSRRVVNENIGSRRAQLRRVTNNIAAQKAVRDRAQKWGEALDWFYDKVAKGTPQSSVATYVIDGTEHATATSGTTEFWQAVLDSNSGISAVIYNPRLGSRLQVALDMTELQDVVGESLRPKAWTTMANEQLVREQGSLLADLEYLRTADFEQLAKRPDFALSAEGKERTFSDLLAETIGSELGQVLIAEGYINRYYNMYIAQYYGDRLPPNAMSFIVQNVDPNRYDFNYQFEGSEEISALLKETKRSFLKDKSAYNIGILDYLLENQDEGAHTILDTLTRRVGDTEQAFLDSYLGAGLQSRQAVKYLATRWPEIFKQLIDEAELSDDQRIALVDTALANSSADVDYELGDSVREFMQGTYRRLPTIAEPIDPGESEEVVEVEEVDEMSPEERTTTPEAIPNAVATLSRVGFVCDDLSALREAARRPVVETDCYALTAANLRTILGDDASLSLDAVRAADEELYRDLLERTDEYLHALLPAGASDSAHDGEPGSRLDAWTIARPGEFITILTDIAELPSDQAGKIIESSNPDCVVHDIADVPQRLWESLARLRRFPATLSNVDAYTEYLGEVDAHLAAILEDAGKIDVPEPSDDAANSAEESPDREGAETDTIEHAKRRVAGLVLHAKPYIAAGVRARLVGSLDLRTWLPVEEVPAEHGPLLGYLIEERVCSDTASTFAHFDTSHWETLSFAITRSSKFSEFVTPELLPPKMTRLLLESRDIRDALKTSVLDRFDEFVASDDSATLAAAAHASLSIGFFLSASRIATIAQVTEDADLVMRLVNQFRDQLTTDEVLNVLINTGGPYSRLATAGEKITFPRTDDHEAVFQRLRTENRISSRAHAKTLTKPARIDVEVL